MALVELFGWLKYFREQRRRENLDQRGLLKKELKLLAYAMLGVFVVMGFFFCARMGFHKIDDDSRSILPAGFSGT